MALEDLYIVPGVIHRRTYNGAVDAYGNTTPTESTEDVSLWWNEKPTEETDGRRPVRAATALLPAGTLLDVDDELEVYGERWAIGRIARPVAPKRGEVLVRVDLTPTNG